MSELSEEDLHALCDYTIQEFIGRSQAETWRGDGVIIKIYRFGERSDWKGLDLFRREIATLQHLNHPRIPKYIDHKEVEVDGGLNIYLVQEFIEGETLEKTALRDEEAIIEVAQGVLEILIYLESFSPPVIHRDIKPANVIVNGSDVYLVDFGAVQLVAPAHDGGSTIVGTSGYMPFEQVLGRAVPASDLHGLGMTLVYLLTGKSPDALPLKSMRVLWRDEVKIPISAALEAFVHRLTEPIAEDRFADAEEALMRLNSKEDPDLKQIRVPTVKALKLMSGDGRLVLRAGPRFKERMKMSLWVGVAALIGFYFIRLGPLSLVGALLAIGLIVLQFYVPPFRFEMKPEGWTFTLGEKIVNRGQLRDLVGVRKTGDDVFLVTETMVIPLVINLSYAELATINESIESYQRQHVRTLLLADAG